MNFKTLTRHKTLAHYLSSSFLSLPVSLLTGFIVFRSVDPYLMGIWGTMLIYETYANFFRLGIINGMNRELPYALGAGNTGEAMKYAQTTLSFTLINILVIFLLTPFIAWNFEFNKFYIAGISIALLRVTLSFYTTYLSGTFRSDDSFKKLSNIQYSLLVVKLLTCPLVFTGFYGFLVFELIQVLANTVLLHHFRPFKINPKFHIPEFLKLFKIGLPIFITSYLMSVVDTFPRLFILHYSQEKMLGLYAPVILLLTTVAIVPGTLSTYMYPKLSFHFGQKNDGRAIWRQLLKIYTLSFFFILLCMIIIYFIIDYFVLLFPKYSESLPYLKLALLACPFVFFKLGNMLNTILKNYFYMLMFVAIYALIQAASLFFLFRLYSDILKVVIYSQVITSFLMLLISMMMNYRLLSVRQPVKPL
jgi:O-antigen/teichoic acid export membrane protein